MADSNRKQSDGKRIARGPGGRFRKGCTPGPGRPSGRVAAEEWRAAFNSAVTSKDIAEVAGRLVSLALEGERWAVELLLAMCIGRPSDTDLVEQLEKLERLVEERIAQK